MRPTAQVERTPVRDGFVRAGQRGEEPASRSVQGGQDHDPVVSTALALLTFGVLELRTGVLDQTVARVAVLTTPGTARASA